MATVYLAEDLKHDRRVAIKVLRPELAAVIGAERFLREIRTIAGLQHPHILGLIDSGQVDGTAYYVMPFVDGESLRDRLEREKQLPIADAVRIATEVASALDYAHRHDIVHRDIKPENILLHDGRALVADFGIALAVSTAGSTRMTETGMSLGTPHYMSPEQAMGEREITGRCDIYALGAMTYEMLTGDPPFTGSTAQAIVAKVVTEAPRPLAAQRHTIPPHVEEAVLTALEKLPADRYATAAEFARALTDATAAVRPAAASRAATIRRTDWRAVGAAAAAMLVVGALLSRAFWPSPAPAVAPARLLIGFPDGQQPRLTTSQQPMLAVPPDGSGLLYSGPGTAARTQLWLRRWSSLDGTRLAQSVDDPCCGVFSPSGDSIAYLASPHTLRVIPLRSGVPAVVADAGLTSVSDYGGGVDWGSDGMLYISGLAGLLRVSPGGGATEVMAPLDTARGHLRYVWPDALPGARAALVTVVPAGDQFNVERMRIAVADFRSGTVREILQGTRALYAESGHIVYARPGGVLHAVPFDVETLALTGSEVALPDTVGLPAQSLGDFSISASGTLAYNKAALQTSQVVWVTRSGEPSVVAPDLAAHELDGATLSPDGSELVVSMRNADGKYDLWRAPTDGGARTRLTFDGTTNWRPFWKPGSRTVWFVSDRADGGVNRLTEVDLRVPGDVQLTQVYESRPVSGGAWSSDGSWLLLRTDDQSRGGGDILGFRPGRDTVARPFVATPAEEASPALSPDGNWLAYSSNVSGRREIYVRPFPETGRGVYQVSTEGGIAPRWSRRGGELFYIDGRERMIAVPVRTVSGFETGEQRMLFDASRYQNNPYHPQYDLSADDSRFLMIRAQTGNTANVVVVFGFLDELRRTVESR